MALKYENMEKHADIYEIIKRVDDFLRESLIANQQVLNDAINDLLNAGGKRLRPAMVCWQAVSADMTRISSSLFQRQ